MESTGGVGQSVVATPSPACDSSAIGHSSAASTSRPQRNTACFQICKKKMAWRSLQWDNFYRCFLWSSSLCSLLTFKDRHIHCWNGRIQVTSWDICDDQKYWNALHSFLNWKLTWTTMLYLPTSCSKGSFFLFLHFFFEHWKSWRVSCTFLHFQVCVSAPSTCPFLSLSRAPGLVLSFFASQLQWEAPL